MTITMKSASFITFKRSLLIVLGFFGLLGFGLIFGGDPQPQPHHNHYPWQQRCDDRCAAALGDAYMKKYDGEDCELLRRDRRLWQSFLPEDVEHYDERIAALTDRIAYEHCD